VDYRLMLTHRVITTEGTRIHLVEAGTGPLVLLVHGFPESWYSWRHQLEVLAGAGYRAVAIDVRGYGRSSAPTAVDEYRMVRHVADNVGVVDALGETEAVIVGHDWGAPIAWNSSLLRPDLFNALVLLSVPYAARSATRPLAAFAERMPPGEEFYIQYFQEPGRAEAEIEPDVRSWLLGFYFTASGDAPTPERGRTMGSVSAGEQLRERFATPDVLPPWLTEEDLDFYVAEFERTGLTGGLNRYRNIDRDWQDLAAFSHAPITVPSLFVGGERDGPTMLGARAIERFPQTLPGLRGSHILPGCGHWIQQERPDEINAHLLDFLKAVR
jgi:pimeloyl-ACP methyl ester carboxylesterase